MPNIVYIATSLDGFIASEDGGLDWLFEIENPDQQDYGYSEFIKNIDAVLIGRKTFETVLSFGSWPYKIPVFILSSTLDQLPENLKDKAEIIKGDPHSVVEIINSRGFNRLYIDGGITIQNFLSEDLIDELIITRIPVLLGKGIPLFGELNRKINFKLVSSASFPNSLVQCRYIREK